MAYFDYEDYYFGGIQEAPFGDPSIFPLRQGDIDKLAPGEGGSGNVDPEQTEVIYTANGVNIVEPSDGFDGLSSVKVEVNVPTPSIKQDTVNVLYNKEGVYTINASQYGVDGLNSVEVEVNVPSATSVTKFYYSNGFMSESNDTIITYQSYSSGSPLVSVVIGDSVTSIGDGAFNGRYTLTSVTIGNSVTSIGADAFVNCNGLKSIEIPNSVTSIGRNAFANCSLTSVTIPNSVTSIGDYALVMDEIILESNTPIQLTEGAGSIIQAFGSIESGSGSGGEVRDLKIHVPMEAFDNYYNSTDPGWVYYRDCLVGYN